MSELVLPVLVMALLVLGEAALLQYGLRRQVHWHDVIFNLNSGHIVLWLFRGLEVLCYGLVAQHFSLHLLSQLPPWGLWLFAFFAWDFCFYWLHRAHHSWRWLWAVHSVHHQGEHFNLSLGVRNSWYSSLTSIPFFLPLALLGVPLSVFVTVSILHYTLQLLNHNALVGSLGWLEKFMVTPTHHRVHHLHERALANHNFSGSLIVWDKCFGTFHQAPDRARHVYGIQGSHASLNPGLESNLPFWRLLRPRQGPGRPSPAPAFRSTALMVLGGAAPLFALVLGYIQRYGYGWHDVSLAQGALLVLLAAGSTALGALADGRPWGLALWGAVALLYALIFPLWLQWHGALWLGCAALLLVHAAAVLAGWGRQRLSTAAPEPLEPSAHV